jgi:hypothetical protein
LLKGNDVIDSYVFKDEDIKSKFDGDDRFPFPYILNHPRPPDDFASAVQAITPLKKEPEDEANCQYCGMKLTEEEKFTHFCKKKPEQKK